MESETKRGEKWQMIKDNLLTWSILPAVLGGALFTKAGELVEDSRGGAPLPPPGRASLWIAGAVTVLLGGVVPSKRARIQRAQIGITG